LQQTQDEPEPAQVRRSDSSQSKDEEIEVPESYDPTVAVGKQNNITFRKKM